MTKQMRRQQTEGGKKRVEKELLGLIRAKRFSEANSLLRRSASLKTSGHSMREAFIRACKARRPQTVKLLLQRGMAVDAKWRENTGMYVAGFIADYKVVRLLVEHGAQIDGRSKDGDTPLIATCRGASWVGPLAVAYSVDLDHVRVARFLIRRGADVNALNQEGRTALSFAAESGYYKLVRVLLSSGADPNVVSGRAESPIWYAAKSKDSRVIAALLAAGAECDRTGRSKTTALFIAAREGNEDGVKLLLSAGADPGYPNPEGVTPVEAARNGGHIRVYRILEAAQEWRKNSEPKRRKQRHRSAHRRRYQCQAQEQRTQETQATWRTAMLSLKRFVGRYRVDLAHSARLIAASFNEELAGSFNEELTGSLGVNTEELKRRLMETPEEEQEVYLEVSPKSLILSGNGEEEVFHIQDVEETDQSVVLRVIDEEGVSWEFRLRQIAPGTIHVGADEHSIGHYAWTKVE
ncbi:MAG TPA: ankyrin repeat domain-containing protein [Gemmataceae bacterium]|nr:ankyrin repeat domain-containing protein [Gemmataceae bacterium]